MNTNDLLQTDDFVFDGSLGSDGATIRKIAARHFAIELQAAPTRPRESNLCQFEIRRHARGNSLRLDVTFNGGYEYPFNTSFVSWSYDARNWIPQRWQRGYLENKKYRDDGVDDTLIFPAFGQDRVFAANQVPMSFEHSVELLKGWADRGAPAHLSQIGASLEGRPIYRLEITADNSAVPYAERQGHYIAAQHPSEHNAMWRMAGMIEWLLAPSAAATRFLENNVCYFVLMMSPDSPRRGYMRVNTRGEDLNRGYRKAGAQRGEQPHEAWICQADFEQLTRRLKMATTWAMHTWEGIVEPMSINLGRPVPECLALDDEIHRIDPDGQGRVLPVFAPEVDLSAHVWGFGPIQQFGVCLHDRVIKLPELSGLKKTIYEADRRKLIKPLSVYNLLPTDRGRSWGTGPLMQFGIPTFLCEGACNILTREENLESGRALIEGIARFYS